MGIQISSFPRPMNGANAGKKIIIKFNTHFNISLNGNIVLTIEFIDPSPTNLRSTPKTLESILTRYFGTFFANFFVLNFMR